MKLRPLNCWTHPSNAENKLNQEYCLRKKKDKSHFSITTGGSNKQTRQRRHDARRPIWTCRDLCFVLIGLGFASARLARSHSHICWNRPHSCNGNHLGLIPTTVEDTVQIFYMFSAELQGFQRHWCVSNKKTQNSVWTFIPHTLWSVQCFTHTLALQSRIKAFKSSLQMTNKISSWFNLCLAASTTRLPSSLWFMTWTPRVQTQEHLIYEAQQVFHELNRSWLFTSLARARVFQVFQRMTVKIRKCKLLFQLVFTIKSHSAK